jgi:uncharacterized protein YegP (UPF0339 family)
MTLEFYRSGLGRRWRWRLIAANGEKVAQSSQGRGFARAEGAVHNANLVLALDLAPEPVPAPSWGRPDIISIVWPDA